MLCAKDKGGRLKEEERELSKSLGNTVKLVEKGGRQLGQQLCPSNLLKDAGCERADCDICKQGSEGMSCYSSNVTYRNRCMICSREGRSSSYIGETSRSLYERSREHVSLYTNSKEESHMLQHMRDEHEDEEKADFKWEIIKSHKSSFERQISEAVYIRMEEGKSKVLNNKQEYSRCILPQISVSYANKDYSKEANIIKELEAVRMNTTRKKRKERHDKETGGNVKKKRKEIQIDRSNVCNTECKIMLPGEELSKLPSIPNLELSHSFGPRENDNDYSRFDDNNYNKAKIYRARRSPLGWGYDLLTNKINDISDNKSCVDLPISVDEKTDRQIGVNIGKFDVDVRNITGNRHMGIRRGVKFVSSIQLEEYIFDKITNPNYDTIIYDEQEQQQCKVEISAFGKINNMRWDKHGDSQNKGKIQIVSNSLTNKNIFIENEDKEIINIFKKEGKININDNVINNYDEKRAGLPTISSKNIIHNIKSKEWDYNKTIIKQKELGSPTHTSNINSVKLVCNNINNNSNFNLCAPAISSVSCHKMCNGQYQKCQNSDIGKACKRKEACQKSNTFELPDTCNVMEAGDMLVLDESTENIYGDESKDSGESPDRTLKELTQWSIFARCQDISKKMRKKTESKREENKIIKRRTETEKKKREDLEKVTNNESVTEKDKDEITDDIREFLRMDPNFRLYPKLKKIETQVQVEMLAAKQRWSCRDIESRGLKNPEQIRIRKDKEARARNVVQGTNVDYSKIRPTEMKYNKDLNLPNPAKNDQELRIQHQRLITTKIINEFINDKCDKKGEIIGASNMTDAEIRGMEEVRTKVDEGKWLLYTTDKSGKLCLDTPDNYIKAMDKNTIGDKEVDPAEVRGTETQLNNQSKLISKLFMIGSDSNNKSTTNQRRCEASLTASYKPIPLTGGLRKDHKSNYDPIEGPPVRVVCRAKNAPNGPLGNVICPSIRAASSTLNKKTQSECGSTEEMKRHLHDANKRIMKDKFRSRPVRTTTKTTTTKALFVRGNYVIGSVDVKALYPSIQWISGAKEMQKGIVESGIEFNNINIKEACQYVCLNYSKDEITKEGVIDYIPDKLVGTNIKLAAREGDQSSLFDYTDKLEPDKDVKNMIMAMVIKKVTHTTMSNHFYIHKGNIFKQSKGGAIGSELTGEVSKLYMILWDKKYLKKLKTLGINPKLYVRYVDDTLIVVDSIQKGWRYVKNNLVWSQIQEDEDMDTEDDSRTFSILKDIADSIDKDIQWELDTPSNHDDRKLPCLDLKVWMNEQTNIQFEFYKKPMASVYTIHSRSALSSSAKRSTLFQEALRRLINCSPELTWQAKAEHLSKFSQSMMLSEYPSKYRFNIIKGAVDRYKQMEADVNSGTKVWYRNREKIDNQIEFILIQQKRGDHDNLFLHGDRCNCQATTYNPFSQNQHTICILFVLIIYLVDNEYILFRILAMRLGDAKECQQNQIPPRTVTVAKFNGIPSENSNIKMKQRDLDTNNFRLQLDKLTPGQARPATDEGESYRSSYSRSLVHWG